MEDQWAVVRILSSRRSTIVLLSALAGSWVRPWDHTTLRLWFPAPCFRWSHYDRWLCALLPWGEESSSMQQTHMNSLPILGSWNTLPRWPSVCLQGPQMPPGPSSWRQRSSPLGTRTLQMGSPQKLYTWVLKTIVKGLDGKTRSRVALRCQYIDGRDKS